jgi:hypothetical protein
VLLLLPHADSRIPPENAATTDPAMKLLRLIRRVDSGEARIFRNSSSGRAMVLLPPLVRDAY